MAFTLPRLPASGLAGSSPTEQQIWWQQVVEAIEAQENTQNDQIAAITAIQTDLAAQLLQIEQAQADATAAARELARINSYTNPGAVLAASDAVSSATIAVIDHTRIYPVEGGIHVPDVSISGVAPLTGLAYSTRYWVYYDDTTLAVTTPVCHATTTAADAQVGAAAGRHSLGYIDTPASGGTGTTGGGAGVPGGTGGGTVGSGTNLP